MHACTHARVHTHTHTCTPSYISMENKQVHWFSTTWTARMTNPEMFDETYLIDEVHGWNIARNYVRFHHDLFLATFLGLHVQGHGKVGQLLLQLEVLFLCTIKYLIFISRIPTNNINIYVWSIPTDVSLMHCCILKVSIFSMYFYWYLPDVFLVAYVQ